MKSFFDRVSGFWPAGRRDLHWHILPAPDEAAVLTAPYEGLPRPGLAGVPDQWMHCTLLHAIGLAAGDVDTDALVADAAHRTQDVAPFTLTFDRPAIGPLAVELSGWPARPFNALVEAVTDATAAHADGYCPGPSRYPHTSVAYTTTGAEHLNAVDFKAELAHLDRPLSGTVRVDRIHLVEQWHDGTHITWRPLAEVPLTGAHA